MEVDVARFSGVVCFVFVGVENVVVATSTEAFGVESHFSLASLASHTFRFPFEFLVAAIAEAFGVMFFFFLAVCAFLDYDIF